MEKVLIRHYEEVEPTLFADGESRKIITLEGDNINAPSSPFSSNLKHQDLSENITETASLEIGQKNCWQRPDTPKGFSTIINSSSSYKQDAVAVQASLSKVGINVALEMLEHGTWRKYLLHKKLKYMGVHTTPY
jgi:hypothetical protein